MITKSEIRAAGFRSKDADWLYNNHLTEINEEAERYMGYGYLRQEAITLAVNDITGQQPVYKDQPVVMRCNRNER